MVFHSIFKTDFSFEEFKKDKQMFFVLILLVIAFFLKILPLIIFPIPEYLHAADIPDHYKRIELIKQDIRYIGYEPFYPKGFHIAAAVLSFLMPIGTAIAAITIFFSLIFVFFSYKLALFFSKNKLISLLTAFLGIAITISAEVTGIPTPSPQTVGLALLVMAVYFFAKQKYLLAGLILGFYSITHFSWIVAFFLVLLFFALNNRITLPAVKEKLLPVFAIALPIFLVHTIAISFTAINKITPAISGIQSSYLGLKFFDLMISPLSFFFMTTPPLVILLAFAGVWLIKKNLDAGKKFIVIWFFSLILASQSYWLLEDIVIGLVTPFSTVFTGSRMLVYMIFPLAFLSAIALNRFNQYNRIIVPLLLVVFLAFSLPNLDKKPSLSKKDFEAIEELKKFPIDAVVLPSDYLSQSTILLLGLKIYPSGKDALRIYSGLEPIDTNYIDLILFDGGEKYLIKDPKKEEIVYSGSVYGYKFETKILKDYNTSTSLLNYVAPFMMTFKHVIPITQPPLRIRATDSGEEICFPSTKSEKIGIKCGQGEYLTITGEKRDLIALFDSFDSGQFVNRLFYLIRNNKISFQPEPIGEIGGVKYSIEHIAWAHRWMNAQSELSRPNLFIGNILAALVK